MRRIVFLATPPKRVLRALAGGWTLKAHRFLDGRKIYRLHPLLGQPEPVGRLTVTYLKARGLIHSNKKFPAATYLLTDKGRRLAARLGGEDDRPLSARNYLPD